VAGISQPHDLTDMRRESVPTSIDWKSHARGFKELKGKKKEKGEKGEAGKLLIFRPSRQAHRERFVSAVAWP